MRLPRIVQAVLVALFAGGLAHTTQFAPPEPTAPDKDKLKAIEARLEQLTSALDKLRRQDVRDPALAEIEIYHKAASWVLKHDEFYGKQSGDWTLAVLERGLLRASQQARGETPWWQQTGQAVVRAYRSRIDGSVQPFAVTFPRDYGSDRRKRYRVDFVLHGRDPSLTEVKFLHQHSGDKPGPKEQTWVQVDIFGRGNNAYRWAGETDVLEVMDQFFAVETLLGRAALLDPTRLVLRGFSMGGAGTWQVGLHRPSTFALLGPGAGFTTTHGYIKGLPRLPAYQEACLHIYDAVDYAENAFDVPIVAYSGEKDEQAAAARNIEAELKKLGIPMTHIVAPGLAHQFPAEWQKKAEAEYAKALKKDRPEYPDRVRFVTWTLKYPTCFWVELMALDRHYVRAHVDAERVGSEGFKVKSANVRALHFNLWPGADRSPLEVSIDGQKLEAVRPYQARTGDLHVYLEKREGTWQSALPERLLTERQRRPQKVPGLQGPIDDAFTGPFLCVRGTGSAWHEATEKYAEAELSRFRAEWSKFFRGELPIKDDRDVTAEDLATRSLILFGDPSSNSLIEQVLPGLPLRWSKKEVGWAGKSYDAATHVPVLVYPSPVAPDRYVVLNSGHTFHEKELKGTNALLFPRLGDFAILRLTQKSDLETEVVTAGLFDDFWKLAPAP